MQKAAPLERTEDCLDYLEKAIDCKALTWKSTAAPHAGAASGPQRTGGDLEQVPMYWYPGGSLTTRAPMINDPECP